MVRSAAAGIAAATMLPWVAPEVLRTPELVTGKVAAAAAGRCPVPCLPSARALAGLGREGEPARATWHGCTASALVE